MAKHRHLTKGSYRSNRGRKLPSRRRVDVMDLPKAERKRLITYAASIKELVEREDARGTALLEDELMEASLALGQSLKEVRDALNQYRRYHAAYPEQHQANAFTPLLAVRKESDDSDPSEVDEKPVENIRQRTIPPKGVPITTITDDVEKGRLIQFANKIAELIRIQNGRGSLPPGMLAEYADALGCSEAWISKSMKHQREYLIAYPDEPPVNAHTSRPVGRPKGRNIKDEVKETIEQARVNKKWLSRNGSGDYDEIEILLRKKLIHSLVIETHGKVHSERTTYRILKDYEEEHAARVAVAEYGVEILQNHLPAISNKVGGSGERGQFDIRPIPIIINYRGILCTVHAMWVIDDFTDYVPSWKLLPAKKVDMQGDVYTVDFTSRQVRTTIGVATLKTGRRFRILYADNGTQHGKALEQVMPFMVASGEDPTVLIHRRRRRPRGGGNAEVSLKMIDEFLRYRPYYVSEKDYRKSRKDKRKQDIRTYEALLIDFKAFVHHWNHDPDPNTNEPSRYDLWQAGPDKSLSPPSPINLAFFAASSYRDTREPRREGDCWFWFDTKKYVPFRKDPDLYTQFANVSVRGMSIDILVFEFDDEEDLKIVFFSLDGQETWELAVPDGTRGLSGRKHTEMMQQVERELEHGDNEQLEKFFKKTILRGTDGPLVIDGLRRKKEFYPHPLQDDVHTSGAGTSDIGKASGSAEAPVEPNPVPPTSDVPGATPVQPSNPPSDAPVDHKPVLPTSSVPGSTSVQPSNPPRPHIPNFIKRLRERSQEDDREGK